jgi:diaminohydroxyphosphoribosylaminopyrimidine deaminase/5-amino-6-(5-phosphoribosylamino)uracil reductase
MDYESLMKRALSLARKAEGHTEHYPMVGAVVVKSGRIISEAGFESPGEPHAERTALEKAGPAAQGATLVLNLEPCSHWGRTPPCADFVIRSGIKKVVAGMMDPNPLVSGRGFGKLKAAGVKVVSGVLEPECRRLNRHFVKYITKGEPWLILKLGATADGRIADRYGVSQWITGEAAREYAHKLRSRVQVVMVGAGAMLKDDPALTVRLKGKWRQPRPLIVDEKLRTPLSAKVFSTPAPGGAIIACTDRASGRKRAEIEKLSGSVIVTRAQKNGMVNLKELMKKLGAQKIARVLCEGGSTLAGALLEAGLVDELNLFYAPRLLVDALARPMTLGRKSRKLSQALPLYRPELRRMGEDFLLTAFLHEA